MIYRDWKIGDQVVCLDDSESHEYIAMAGWKKSVGHMDGLKKGETYTIRSFKDDVGILTICLEEIFRSPCPVFGEDPGFAIQRFRKVETKSTDISIFHRIRLNPSIRIREDA